MTVCRGVTGSVGLFNSVINSYYCTTVFSFLQRVSVEDIASAVVAMVKLNDIKVKRYSSPEQVTSELRSVTCHMRSHGVTCYPKQVSTPRLNPSHTATKAVLDLPTPDGWKAELT